MLKLVGRTLISTVGGASGPLYGTAFRETAKALGDAAEVDDATLAAALRAGLDGVVRLGKAEEGDKTMVDAWLPALAALDAALGSRVPLADAAAEAAARRPRPGAEATIPMQARKGRASYLGPRSIGHQDPGATSSTMLFAALAKVAAGWVGPALELRDLAGLLGRGDDLVEGGAGAGGHRRRHRALHERRVHQHGPARPERPPGRPGRDSTAEPRSGITTTPSPESAEPSAAATASGEVPIRPSSVPAAVITVTSGASCAISSTSPLASVAECETSTRPTIAQTPSSAVIRPGVSGSSSNRTNRSPTG